MNTLLQGVLVRVSDKPEVWIRLEDFRVVEEYTYDGTQPLDYKSHITLANRSILSNLLPREVVQRMLVSSTGGK
jgi:hypothetical protein